MSLETSETELPKRKKAAVKAKAKPVADRHRVTALDKHEGHTGYDLAAMAAKLDDASLSELQAAIALEVTGRHARIREQLEAQAAAIGAKVTFPGKGKGQAAPVKYRGPNGETWAGRGMKPVWLREQLDGGRSLADFAV